MGASPDLLKRAAAGDDAAWREIVGHYQRLVHATIRSFRVPPSDAEDLFQETFLRLYRHAAWLRDSRALTREAADLQHQMDELGERGSSQKRLEERHRRELRRHRIDELKVGLAASAATYRDALVEGRGHHPAAAVGAVQDIHQAIEALERNPNEHLLLQALLLRLPAL
jgi:hypothetical protein